MKYIKKVLRFTVGAGVRVFLLLALLLTPLQAQQVLDRILAVVDDDVILESEVAQGAYLTAMQYGIDPAKSPREFPRSRLRRGLADARVVEGRSKPASRRREPAAL